MKSITSINVSSCLLSCYQPSDRARDYPFRLLPSPIAFYAATCCRIILCAERRWEKMTMMSAGCRRKITFYDEIIGKGGDGSDIVSDVIGCGTMRSLARHNRIRCRRFIPFLSIEKSQKEITRAVSFSSCSLRFGVFFYCKPKLGVKGKREK